MLPPAVLFGKDLRAIPATNSELRNFLDRRGANMSVHSSCRIMMTSAFNVHEDEDHRAAADEIVKNVIFSGSQVATAGEPTGSTNAQATVTVSDTTQVGTPIGKLAPNVAILFEDKELKFSWDVGQCWQEQLDEYRQMYKDYN